MIFGQYIPVISLASVRVDHGCLLDQQTNMSFKIMKLHYGMGVGRTASSMAKLSTGKHQRE